MDRTHLNHIIRDMSKLFACPECGHYYAADNINFRGYFRDLYFLQLSCPGHLSMLGVAKVTTLKKGVKIEKALELMEDDAEQFADELLRFIHSGNTFKQVWGEAARINQK